MTAKARTTLVVVALLASAVGIVVVPRLMRAANYRSFVKKWTPRFDLALIPVDVALPSVSPGNSIELGYAKFVAPFEVVSLERNRAIVLLQSAESKITFWTPGQWDEHTPWPVGTADGEPEHAVDALMMAYSADPIAHFRRLLSEQPVSLVRVAAMTDEDYSTHQGLLLLKAIWSGESTELLWFQSGSVEGVVFVGMDGAGKSSVKLWSRGESRIGQVIHVQSPWTESVRKTTLELLASYTFTVDRIPAEDELCALIEKALPDRVDAGSEDE